MRSDDDEGTSAVLAPLRRLFCGDGDDSDDGGGRGDGGAVSFVCFGCGS